MSAHFSDEEMQDGFVDEDDNVAPEAPKSDNFDFPTSKKKKEAEEQQRRLLAMKRAEMRSRSPIAAEADPSSEKYV